LSFDALYSDIGHLHWENFNYITITKQSVNNNIAVTITVKESQLNYSYKLQLHEAEPDIMGYTLPARLHSFCPQQND